jgi:CBS domain-containing protein
MKTVREILLKKGNNIWSVSPDSTILDALKIMADKGIGALLVIDNENLVGIFSERDYARKVVLEGRSSKNSLVKEIMSHRVIYVTIDQSVDDCMALMINKRIRHLPVYENNILTGIVSIGDIVNAVIDEKEFVIDQLVRYITDKPSIRAEYSKINP